jgi:predicted MPP superfamily phosphohydrolase
MGHYKEGNQHLYVNIGLGETMFPFRVGAKPEITVITLKSKSSE